MTHKRLVPGYEAPCYIAYGFKNRSTLLRIPASRGLGTRIECRSPDPSCNPYLAFAVLLEAGLDGLDNKMDPGEPTEENLFALTEDEIVQRGISNLPTSLWINSTPSKELNGMLTEYKYSIMKEINT